MIDVKEHIYNDNPRVGHPDVRTNLKDCCYYFLGNGLIKCAVQVSPSGEGSPYGLIFMDPDSLNFKRDTLSFNQTTGFSGTMIQLINNGSELFLKSLPEHEWISEFGFPAVKLVRNDSGLTVKEIFYCHNFSTAEMVREVWITNNGDNDVELLLKTDVQNQSFEDSVRLRKGNEKKIILVYNFDQDTKTLKLKNRENAPSTEESRKYWASSGHINTDSDTINNFFNIANYSLPGVISKSGKVDAAIWQYKREWVRDHSFMSLGLTLSGHHQAAGVMLQRLIRDFVSENGDCIDSSEQRHPDEVELDQNGALLYAIETYVQWSGDLNIVRENWDKIKKIADYPFKKVFHHSESGMFCNRREYWERHQAHGIQPGIELMYQFFPSIGLKGAAVLARAIGRREEAECWENRSVQLKKAILEHPKFAMVDKRGFIKRRNLDGKIVETISPQTNSGCPKGVPLEEDIDHFLLPDSSAVFPVALEFVPADSPVALATMEQFEQIWNQGWDDGGYARYNMTSEADSESSWPFSGIMIARGFVETGDHGKVWRVLNWLESLPAGKSGSWLEMYGPRISPPYAQQGICPWTWAEMHLLIIHHIAGIQPREDYLRIRPKLLKNMNEMDLNLPIKGNRIKMKLCRVKSDSDLGITCNTDVIFSDKEEIHLPYVNDDIEIKINVR